jgi:hypothetical protein
MRANTVEFTWREPLSTKGFHSAVCLHGHTAYSEECLNFLPRHLQKVPGISQIVRHYQNARGVDFARAWWTPPLSPASAYKLEQDQIAALGLRPIVSITDHDDIRACLDLSVTSDAPISVEWTVPYYRTIFHLGIHNLPRHQARDWMSAMAHYTQKPNEAALPTFLSELARIPGVLVVLNHPFWLEEGVEEEGHRHALGRILRECLEWLHAFELNGTRPWKENDATIELAREYARPVISGGDRHSCEPSACINLTNARSFSEFADEVRGGASSVLFMPQYREPLAHRMLSMIGHILATYPEYPGRERWCDRIYYRGDDGVVRNLTQIWAGREPAFLHAGVLLVQFFAGTRLRPALRLLLSERGEMYP